MSCYKEASLYNHYVSISFKEKGDETKLDLFGVHNYLLLNFDPTPNLSQSIKDLKDCVQHLDQVKSDWYGAWLGSW